MAASSSPDNDEASLPLDRPRSDGEDEARTALIVNYLPQSMSESELFSMFITLGPIKAHRIARDHRTGYSYGYGFVDYENAADAVKALQQLNGLQIQNKRLKVSYSRPPGANVKETNLYICNLGPSASEERLDELFGEFGTILTRNVLRDRSSGQSRGTGFVRFARTEDASRAIEEMNGKSVPGCPAPIEVRVAEEHGKQKSAFFTSYVNMQAQYAQYNAQQGYMSDYNVKKEEEDHYGYGEGEEGGGTYNNWGNNQQNRFNPMGYGRPMGGGGGGRGRFRGRGGSHKPGIEPLGLVCL